MLKEPPAKFGPCRPGRNDEKIKAAYFNGHDLDAILVDGIPTHYCRSCGAHGSWQWRGLMDPCKCIPQSALTAGWLTKALDGGTELQATWKAKNTKQTKPKPRRKKTSNKVKKACTTKKPTDPLRNRAAATLADKVRWGTLDAGLCSSDPVPARLRPAPAQPPKPDPDLLPETDQPSEEDQPEPQVGPRLRPLKPPDAECGGYNDLDEEACPRCSSCVLNSDERCTNCGCPREDAHSQAALPRPPLPLRAASGGACQSLPWYGGTFTPPPPQLAQQAAGSGPARLPVARRSRPPETDSRQLSPARRPEPSATLTPEQAARSLANKEKAQQRKLARHAKDAKEEQESKATERSAAQTRLAARLARVQAKELAAKEQA